MAKKVSLAQLGALLTMLHTVWMGMLTGKSDKFADIDGDKIQEAIDIPDKENFLAELIKWINNGCRLEYILANTFTVGTMFRHRAEKGDKRLYLSDNTQAWYIKPYAQRVIAVKTDLPKISEYRLPGNMDDTAVQEAKGNPGFMDFDTYMCVMYLLIFQPELAKQVLGYELRKDKWYLLHVELPGGKKVAVDVNWDAGEWFFLVSDVDGRTWDGGDLFLYFVTVK